MFVDMRTAIPMAAALIIYFYFKPNIPEYLIVPFIAAWIACFCLDVKITVSNLHLIAHEMNLVFPTLYKKMGEKSIPFQFLIEAGFVIAIAVIFENTINVVSVSIVALVFGVAHLEAYFANMYMIKKLARSNL